MTILFLIFILLVCWHFFVQAIFIPNYAHDRKYQLYAKRDELRRIYIEGEISKEEFQILDSYISNLIFYFRNITIFDVLFLKPKRLRPVLLNQLNHSIKVMENCKNETYIKIRKSAVKSSLKISVVNSMGWLPYFFVLIVIPMLIIRLLTNIKLYSKLKARINHDSNEIAVLGDKAINGIALC